VMMMIQQQEPFGFGSPPYSMQVPCGYPMQVAGVGSPGSVRMPYGSMQVPCVGSPGSMQVPFVMSTGIGGSFVAPPFSPHASARAPSPMSCRAPSPMVPMMLMPGSMSMPFPQTGNLAMMPGSQQLAMMPGSQQLAMMPGSQQYLVSPNYSAQSPRVGQDSSLMTPTKNDRSLVNWEAERSELANLTPGKTALPSNLELSAKEDKEDTAQSDKDDTYGLMLEGERQIARRRTESLEHLAEITDTWDDNHIARESHEEVDDHEAMLEREVEIARRRSVTLDSLNDQEDQPEVQTVDLRDFRTSTIPGTSEDLVAVRAKSRRDYQEWASRNNMREASKAAGSSNPSTPPAQRQESVQLGSVQVQSRGLSIDSASDLQSVTGPSMPGSCTPWRGVQRQNSVMSSPPGTCLMMPTPGLMMPPPGWTSGLMMPPPTMPQGPMYQVASPAGPMYPGTFQCVYPPMTRTYSAMAPGMMLATNSEPLNYRCKQELAEDDDAEEVEEGSWFSSLFRR